MLKRLLDRPRRAVDGFRALSPAERLRPALMLTALLSGGLIAGALFMEHVMGVLPCKLCLIQRYPHYAVFALSAAGLALGAAGLGARPLADLRTGLLFAAGMAFLYTGGYGLFHTGVERGWWPGPADCSGSALPNSISALGTLLAQGEEFVRCDAPPWTVLGLSLASYNALLSLAAAVFAFMIAAACLKTRMAVPRGQHG